MSKNEFVREVLQRLKAAETVANIAPYSGHEFLFDITYVGEEGTNRINLEHAYRTYIGDTLEEERQRKLDEHVRFFANPLKSVEFDRTRIFPLVRHFHYLGENADMVWNAFSEGAQLPDDYDGHLVRPFGGDLVMLLGQETEAFVSFVSESELNVRGLSVDAAWDAAFENLLCDHFDLSFDQIGDGGLCIFHFEHEMWLTPSLLLLPSIFEDFMAQNDVETLLVAVPSRMGVLFIPESIPDAMAQILAVSAQMLQADHPQSENMFRLRRGQDEMELVQEVEMV